VSGSDARRRAGPETAEARLAPRSELVLRQTLGNDRGNGNQARGGSASGSTVQGATHNAVDVTMEGRARRAALILDVRRPRQGLSGRPSLGNRAATPEQSLQSKQHGRERARNAPRSRRWRQARETAEWHAVSLPAERPSGPVQPGVPDVMPEPAKGGLPRPSECRIQNSAFCILHSAFCILTADSAARSADP
jgi:hypothetical protein